MAIPSATSHMIVESFVEILGDYCATNAAGTLSKVSFLSPSSVTCMLQATFINCKLLTEVDFRNCTKMTYCLSSNFKGCSSLERVYFPPGFVTFDSSVFVGTSLKSFEFSKSATRTGAASFEDVTTLTSVDFSKAIKIESILGRCFKNTGIKALDLRKCIKLTNIEASAFQGCTKLETIFLPCKSTLALQQDSFFGCTSIRSVFIPCRAKPKIAVTAFNNCSSLILPAGLIQLQKTCNVYRRLTSVTYLSNCLIILVFS